MGCQNPSRARKSAVFECADASFGTRHVAALFNRLEVESRARRFNGAKPRLSDAELAQTATVNGGSHTLVAYVDGDPEPAGIAQLVRDPHHWAHAEIAFGVADCYQGSGIGSTLVELVAGDARAAGITHLTATIWSSNSVHRPVRCLCSCL